MAAMASRDEEQLVALLEGISFEDTRPNWSVLDALTQERIEECTPTAG